MTKLPRFSRTGDHLREPSQAADVDLQSARSIAESSRDVIAPFPIDRSATAATMRQHRVQAVQPSSWRNSPMVATATHPSSSRTANAGSVNLDRRLVARMSEQARFAQSDPAELRAYEKTLSNPAPPNQLLEDLQAQAVAQTVKHLPVVGPAIELAESVGEVYQAFRSPDRFRSLSQVVGRRAIGTLGNMLGETAGKVIGTVIGGPGGAAAGNFVGGEIGSNLGSRVGERIADNLVDRARGWNAQQVQPRNELGQFVSRNGNRIATIERAQETFALRDQLPSYDSPPRPGSGSDHTASAGRSKVDKTSRSGASDIDGSQGLELLELMRDTREFLEDNRNLLRGIVTPTVGSAAYAE
jgi:uncharacterized protein YcfJ